MLKKRKFSYLFILAIFLMSIFVPIGVLSVLVKDHNVDSCGDKPSQLEMNQCINNEFKELDNQMEDIAGVIYRNEKDLEEVEFLRISQKNWVDYRDNYCTWKSGKYDGGSFRIYAYYSCQKDLTQNRIDELKLNID